MDDSFALCMARQQSLASLLTLMGAYREELEYTVLSHLITVLFPLYLLQCLFQLLHES